MDSWKRLLSAVGPGRAISTLGGMYIVFAAGRAFVRIDQGSSFGNVLVVTLLIAAPGALLVYGGHWMSRADIDPEFYPDIVWWCLAGLGAMVSILLLYHLQPGDSISSPARAPPILMALSSFAGFGVGIHDARAKTRTLELKRRNQELHDAQAELEGTVDQLAESEQRYRTLMENFPNGGVALLDTELRHTLVGGQGFEKVDFGASDLRGERVQDVYSGELLEVIEANYRATLDGEPASFDIQIQGRTFEFRTHPLTDDGGDVFAVLAMYQDITERKQREQQLAKRARQQQAVADLGQFALETDDLDDFMHEAARQVADVLGNEYCKVLDLDEESEELLLRQGVGWDEGIVGEATVSAVEADSQAAYTLANDHPVVVEDLDAETRFSGPDLLTSHDVHSGISTIIGPFDEPWGILGTHDVDRRTFTEEDVSFVQGVANVLAEAIERHRYQEELEELIADLEVSNERLEQFAHAASHDLQEPLRMVSTYLQLVERRYEDELDEEGREYLEFAVDGADRMRSMIDGLLEYSRVERDAPLEPVDLETVLEDTREDLQVAIENNDATITADSLPRVEGDPHQLRQVFQNLLENAVEYSEDAPVNVHVSAQQNGTEWIVSVQDDGVGIAPEDQDRIFEVFERVHDRNEGDGTGIGLALCERIVERHGGNIWVESEPGEETRFSFTLSAVRNVPSDL